MISIPVVVFGIEKGVITVSSPLYLQRVSMPRLQKSSSIELGLTGGTLLNGVKLNQVIKECPECGGQMLCKMARKGPGKGKLFLGCNQYPTCAYAEPYA